MGKKKKKASNIRRAWGVEHAYFSRDPPDFVRRPKRTGARGRGVRYEEEAKKHLSKLLGYEFVPGPWMVFIDATGKRWCQPDGLWIDVVRGRITIIEIKYSHCIDAYYQLKELYEPVLRAAFAGAPWEFRLVELVRWYDKDTEFPGNHNLRPRLELAREDEIAVHIWNPKKQKLGIG